MRDDFRIQVYNTLKQEKTSDLIKIWKRNDSLMHSELALEVIREILEERLGKVPSQNQTIYEVITKILNGEYKHIRKYIILAMSIIFIMLGLRYMIFLNARHHLLCDELKFGMSVDDVLGVLRQNGEFVVNKSEFSGGTIQLVISFTNPKSKALYGGFFNLDFSRYKYVSAYTGGNDLGPPFEGICHAWPSN